MDGKYTMFTETVPLPSGHVRAKYSVDHGKLMKRVLELASAGKVRGTARLYIAVEVSEVEAKDRDKC